MAALDASAVVLTWMVSTTRSWGAAGAAGASAAGAVTSTAGSGSGSGSGAASSSTSGSGSGSAWTSGSGSFSGALVSGIGCPLWAASSLARSSSFSLTSRVSSASTSSRNWSTSPMS